MPKDQLFLIDANALCYRSFFAIKGLTTSYGQATNAVFGFLNTLRKIFKDYNPKYMAVCFDVGKKTRRQEKFAEYKVHRPPMPDDLVSQIPLIKKCVLAYDLPLFELEGFEADDLIATIVKKLESDKLEIVIVSGDKDMLQLVNKNVKLYNLRMGSTFDEDQARDFFGIDPRRIADFIGLAGDKTDNIPGINGIGNVTARMLINEFGSVENILKNTDKIKSAKVKERIAQQKEQAIFSKELAVLDDKVPIKFNLSMLKIGDPDTQLLFKLFKELEFKKMADELAVENAEYASIKELVLKSTQDCSSLAEQIQDKERFSFFLDSSTENRQFRDFYISIDEQKVYRIKMSLVGHFKKVFENTRILKICHNAKEAIKVLNTSQINLADEVFDVLLAGYLLAPSASAYDIPSLAWTYLKQAGLGSKKDSQLTPYLLALEERLKKELQEKELLKLFNEIEIPLTYVLADMEFGGVNIDKELLTKLSKECEKKIETLMEKLYKLAGIEFNLNSPKQLSQVLFERLKLPVVKKTKTGFSTDEGVLTKLAEKHELPALILEYRQIAKLKSTYIDALPRLVDAETKRIHASFNQAGTETGRFSSSNPNLQNIPIRTDLGRQIRKAFVPSGRDYCIISADYSQIELRILAHLSKDKQLIKAFKEDQDIHSFTASLIFDVKEKDVDYDMRNTAKRVNFGIIYGMSPFGLAKDLKISQSKAQEFIDRYFLRYPSVKQFMDSQIKMAQEKGYVLTLLNRRRYLPEIGSDNMAVAQFAQRQAINTPVQGSAADLIKLAMINIDRELKKVALKSRMIITVHDELVFDVLKKEKKQMIDLIRREMEHTLALLVPIKVDIGVGDNWLDLTDDS